MNADRAARKPTLPCKWQTPEIHYVIGGASLSDVSRTWDIPLSTLNRWCSMGKWHPKQAAHSAKMLAIAAKESERANKEAAAAASRKLVVERAKAPTRHVQMVQALQRSIIRHLQRDDLTVQEVLALSSALAKATSTERMALGIRDTDAPEDPDGNAGPPDIAGTLLGPVSKDVPIDDEAADDPDGDASDGADSDGDSDDTGDDADPDDHA